MTAPLVVGYDGSRYAQAAVRWALNEAARHDAPVHLVYVYEWASPVVPVPTAGNWPDPLVRREAEAAVQEAAERFREARPSVELTATVVDGTVVATLCDRSRRARALVVGDRGMGGFPDLRAGSVAVGAASHATCPVVVVRGSASPRLPVAVGVEESPDAQAALEFAYTQAQAREVPLLAVRAWQPPPVPARDGTPRHAFDRIDLAETQRELAVRVLHPFQQAYPEVPVDVRLLPGSAARALLSAAERSQLVVVGARGRGGMPGPGLGSATLQLVHHAHCPVAVVRAVGGQAG